MKEAEVLTHEERGEGHEHGERAALHEARVLEEKEVAEGEVAELGGEVNGLKDRGP